MLQNTASGAALAAISAPIAACGHGRRISQPYPPGQSPDPQSMWQGLAPRFQSVRVERAKARQGMLPSVIFSCLAQAPKRLHAILTLKGQELLSLVTNEQQYGLRYTYDRGMTPGFYHGPLHACAVQAFLGVELSVPDLISILLGGGPQSLQPDKVIAQRWDTKQGIESITFYEHRRRQAHTINFRPEAGAWVFVGATGYQYEGKRPIRLWTISHKSFHRDGQGTVYPKHIIIETLYKGAWEQTHLEIETVHLDVHIAQQHSAAAQESQDFEDEEGWESADGSALAQSPDDQDSQDDQDDTRNKEASPDPARADIPSVFIPNPSGLTDRGDLCASRPGVFESEDPRANQRL